MMIDRRSLLKCAGLVPLIGAVPRVAFGADEATAEKADYTLRIGTGLVELAPDHIVSTTLYNGQFPGPLLRFKEGQHVIVDVHNDTDTPELVHWHGQMIPSDVDGAAEEGTPFVPAHGMQRISFVPRPSGFRFYHTHVAAGADLNRSTYTGQAGPVYIEPKNNPGAYDREIFLVMKEFAPSFSHGGDMASDALAGAPVKALQQMGRAADEQAPEKTKGFEVGYELFGINGRMLGHGEPIRVKAGERVLFHVLNASATEIRSLAFPGHVFRVVALDGNPVPTQADVPVLWLGTAERISALVDMKHPGVWGMGDLADDDRKHGMGIVVEYAGQKGKPQWIKPKPFHWDYAHLGYFERTYVRERRWLTPDEYGGLVALCQMVPGPASSQVSYLIGLRRAGWSGAFAAWAGFTLPSAIVMFGFALLAPHLGGPATNAVLHGLKLVAVAVVAQAVWSMARNLCPDRPRAALALLAAALLLVVSGSFVQIAALLIGAIGGALLCRNLPAAPGLPAMPVSLRTGGVALALFLILLVTLPLAGAAAPHTLLALAGIFYKAGALVFGGGHVVLPLLRDALVPQGWLSDSSFLAGYGVAQAIPGPLFTFSAYLGAVVAAAGAALFWSAVALIFIFLPGVLIALAGLQVWLWLAHHPAARAALAGINAAVVGVLGAALYNPIWLSAIGNGRDVAIALTGFLLLERWRLPPLAIVVFCVVVALIAASTHTDLCAVVARNHPEYEQANPASRAGEADDDAHGQAKSA